MRDRGSRSRGGDGSTAETSLLQIKTNFESNLNLALRDYNVTADRHSEAVDTIQRTVSAAGWCLSGLGEALTLPWGVPWDPLWYLHAHRSGWGPFALWDFEFGRRC